MNDSFKCPPGWRVLGENEPLKADDYAAYAEDCGPDFDLDMLSTVEDFSCVGLGCTPAFCNAARAGIGSKRTAKPLVFFRKVAAAPAPATVRDVPPLSIAEAEEQEKIVELLAAHPGKFEVQRHARFDAGKMLPSEVFYTLTELGSSKTHHCGIPSLREVREMLEKIIRARLLPKELRNDVLFGGEWARVS